MIIKTDLELIGRLVRNPSVIVTHRRVKMMISDIESLQLKIAELEKSKAEIEKGCEKDINEITDLLFKNTDLSLNESNQCVSLILEAGWRPVKSETEKRREDLHDEYLQDALNVLANKFEDKLTEALTETPQQGGE